MAEYPFIDGGPATGLTEPPTLPPTMTVDEAHRLARTSHFATVRLARTLAAEVERLREVERAAQAYVMAGLCGNPDASAELVELIRVARTDA